MKARLLFPALLLLMALTQPLAAADLSAGLTNKLWKLVKWQQKDKLVQMEPTSRGGIMIMFTANGKVSGIASINRFSGSYKLEGKNGLRWGEGFTMTKMAGAEPMMKQENAFMSDLPTLTQYSLEGGQLRLSNPGGGTTMTFDPTKMPGQPPQ